MYIKGSCCWGSLVAVAAYRQLKEEGSASSEHHDAAKKEMRGGYAGETHILLTRKRIGPSGVHR